MERNNSTRGGSNPPAQPVKILSVPAMQVTYVRFLGPVQGLNTHWHAGRTVPCNGPDECPANLHRTRIVYKAYGPVERWDGPSKLWCPEVLEATEHLEEMLRGRSLRGEVWMLSRGNERGKSEPVFGVYCETLPASKVSDPFDIQPVLLRCFHVSHLKLGVANSLPPKLILPAVQGEPPTLPAGMAPVEPVPASPADFERMREFVSKLRGAKPSAGSAPENNGAPPESNGKPARPK